MEMNWTCPVDEEPCAKGKDNCMFWPSKDAPSKCSEAAWHMRQKEPVAGLIVATLALILLLLAVGCVSWWPSSWSGWDPAPWPVTTPTTTTTTTSTTTTTTTGQPVDYSASYSPTALFLDGIGGATTLCPALLGAHWQTPDNAPAIDRVRPDKVELVAADGIIRPCLGAGAWWYVRLNVAALVNPGAFLVTYHGAIFRYPVPDFTKQCTGILPE